MHVTKNGESPQIQIRARHFVTSHATMNGDTTAAALAGVASGNKNMDTNGDDTRRPSPKSVAVTSATTFDDDRDQKHNIGTSATSQGEDADVNANNDEPEQGRDTVIAPTSTAANDGDDGSADGLKSSRMQIVPASSAAAEEKEPQQMILAPPPNPRGSQSIFAGFKLKRESITIAGLAIAGGIMTTLTGTVCFIGLAAFASSPLWLPLLLITSPFWLPFAFFTSPLWVSAVAIGAICLLWAAFFAVLAFGAFLFFSWPAKWLPKDSDKSKWFLCQRDRATLALVKLQAKIVLYAAGVGPLADAAFAITDRIDLVELQKALSDFDLAQFAEDVKKMDIGEIQRAIVGAIRSFIGI